MSTASSLAPAAQDDKTQQQRTRSAQRLRIRRLGMSFGSQLVSLGLVVFCWSQGLLPWWVIHGFAIITLITNGIFFLLIRSGYNLRFTDPSMTAAQMVIALIAPLWATFWLDSGQARATLLFLAMVPALYGILALNLKQFLRVAVAYLLAYALLIGAILIDRPQILTPSLELLQAVGFVLVMMQISMIGGYISGLRHQLRRKHAELKSTTTELENALERIQELARRDSLTGLFNRRHLFDVLSSEINRCARANGPFCVAMLDIDHFKPINDTYGHQIGDLVLKKLASLVVSDLRNIDCFGRYGGEEFLLVLPQTQLEGALVKAERVRAQVAALLLEEISVDFRMTLSIGVAEHQLGETADETIGRADAALYRAKAAGRNRVVSDLYVGE